RGGCSPRVADGPYGPPAVEWCLALLAWAFACRLGLGDPFRHLRFDGVEIEARALLHRRVLDESLELLGDYLLDEYEPPELVLEPIEVLLRAFLRSAVRPARALERI